MNSWIVGGDAGILRVGQEQGATRCQSIASAAVTQPTHKRPTSLRVAQGWASAVSRRVARTSGTHCPLLLAAVPSLRNADP
jgi:hypothetical protein